MITPLALGIRIKTARTCAHMTQDELANKLSVNRATISKYESGIIEPTAGQIQKIADALGTTVEFLYGRGACVAGDIIFTSNDKPQNKLDITSSEYAHIQKYRRLTDNGRATVDQMINTLLEASQAQPQASSEGAANTEDDERVPYPIAALGGGVETKTFSKKDEKAIDDALLALEFLDK